MFPQRVTWSVLAISVLIIFSRENLEKTNVTRDYTMIASVVCVKVTPGKLEEISRSFQNLLEVSGSM
jgi:hypothetical protein